MAAHGRAPRWARSDCQRYRPGRTTDRRFAHLGPAGRRVDRIAPDFTPGWGSLGGCLMIEPSRQSKPVAFQAQEDFARARRRAFLEEIGSFLLRRPNELLSFEEVRQQV